MKTFVIIASIITFIAALVGTLLVGKDVSQKMKQLELEGDTVASELERSRDYETSSLRVNIKSLSWIYVGLALATIITCLGIFFY